MKGGNKVKFLIETKNLHKSINNVSIVHGCDLAIKKGEIYGLLGPNGAGKTTLFKMLTCLISPTSGTAKILGLDIATSKPDIKKRIGTMIDFPIFHENLSATDNIKLHLSYMRCEHDFDNVHIEKTLNNVGLEKTGGTPVSKFSLGMRQRLAIARAIVHKSELLVLDEPTNGLDPAGVVKIRELLLQICKERGVTVLMSSHILTEMQNICQTIGFISKGNIVDEKSVEEIKASYNGLEEYYMNKMEGKQC